jgi:outer membrane receptor protein involved in Fe transport
MVEVKADRTVFNVDGTINSSGSDAVELLRMAPGVVVDNNDNISVLGRNGVMIYVDGRRLPLAGEELSNYLKNLNADQIDKIDIISNPGAKYEAEGNAGIIDIRLKKDKRYGSNGSINASYSYNRKQNYNANVSGNYRNRAVNIFGNAGSGLFNGFHNMLSKSYQNGLYMDEINNQAFGSNYGNYRFGSDFFLSDNQTLGILFSGGASLGSNTGFNRIELAQEGNQTNIDSILVADTEAASKRYNNSINVNYKVDFSKESNLNIDLDYGRFSNDASRGLLNEYYDASESNIVSIVENTFESPTEIEIYTFKLDYENVLFGGKLGTGTKFSKVLSANTFYYNDVYGSDEVFNEELSNIFDYDESVYAAYANYGGNINKKVSYSAGVRAELTDAVGDLQAFLPELEEDPVDLDYLNWFPSAGITYQIKPTQILSLNYGRRINRPDYNVLNPFNSKISELSYEKGNPFLRPEIVNNIELGYTLNYRYNFKLAYSKTMDQITRLIAPDEEDPRAGFITWANLAERTVYSFNASAPIQFTPKWNGYFNVSTAYINNQADYGDGAIVDIQVFNYVLFTQQTFDIPGGIKAELSGYYSGPGVWGGVFKYEGNYGINAGLQKKFLNDKLNIKLSARDIFRTTGWRGESNFNGLRSVGNGIMARQSVNLSANYSFGNQNVKSRRRSTGLEDEAGRVGEGQQ